MSNLKINLDTNNVEGGCVMPDIRKVLMSDESMVEKAIEMSKTIYIQRLENERNKEVIALQDKIIEDLKQLVDRYSKDKFVKVSKENMVIVDKETNATYKFDKDGLWMRINTDKITL